MAEQLEIKIGADISQATSAFKKLESDIESTSKASAKSVSKLGDTIETLRAKMEARKAFLVTETDISKVGKLNREIDSLGSEITRISNAGRKGFDEFGNAVLKIDNPLNKTYSLVRQLAYILPGVGVAGIIGFATEPILKYIGVLIQAKEEFNRIKETASSVAGAKEDYTKAVQNVEMLREHIELAKQGFLSKTDVVREYNKTIGETIGKVSSLDEAEKALTKNADAYIRFTLLKAAANTALAKAADKAFEIAQKNAKPLTTEDLTDGTQRGALEQQAGNVPEIAAAIKKAQDAFLNGNKNYKQLFAERDRLINEYVDKHLNKKLLDEEQGFIDIAKKFNQEAFAISKQFKFTNPLSLPEIKAPKIAKEKTKKDYTDTLLKIFREMQLPNLKIALIPEVRDDAKQIVSSYLLGLRHEFEQKGDAEKIPLSDLFAGEAAFKEFLKNGGKTATQLQEEQIVKARNLADTVSGLVTPAFQGMFDAIFEGRNAVQGFFQGIAQGLRSLLSKMAAALVQALALKAIFSLILPGSTIAKSSVGKLFSGLLGFAQGGVVFGPTAALIGEGRGTSRSNPEIVAPLDKLKGMIGGGGNFPDYLPIVEFTHSSFRAWYEKGNRSQNTRF